LAFKKVGAVFEITSSKTLEGYNQWEEFKKTASTTTLVEPNKASIKDKESVKKEADFNVVADIDPEKFVYVHSTIMAGVKTASNGFWITSETEKYINDNNDSWTCDDLLKDYKSFRTATTFVEHVQELEKAKGKCIDVIARRMDDTILIDVLFSVGKHHKDLVANIESGIVNAVSMGCSTEKTICSICGNVAADTTQYCDHVKMGNKGRMFSCTDGIQRKASEICKGNTFFDVSLVANPAFSGAVFRKILSSSQVSTQLLSNIITSKIEGYNNQNETILKAASGDNNIQLSITQDGSVNIKTAGKEIVANEKLGSDELTSLQNVIDKKCKKPEDSGFSGKESSDQTIVMNCQVCNTPTQKKKGSTKFLGKIINKFFNRDSGYHPITNKISDEDYTISYDDYSEIPFDSPWETLDDFERQEAEYIKMREEDSTDKKSSKFEKFKCYNCGQENDLWQVKASSVDSGNNDSYTCPNCFFISEVNYKESTENSRVNFTKDSMTRVDFLQLKDLGFRPMDIRKLADDQVELILTKSISRKEYEKDPNVSMRKADVSHSITRSLKEDDYDKFEKTIDNLEKQTFVVQKDIPVEEEENNLWYRKTGSSIVAKGEKLSYITSVDNDAYGVFRTIEGRKLFVPYSARIIKKKGLEQ